MHYTITNSPTIQYSQTAGLPTDIASLMPAAPPGALGGARRLPLSPSGWSRSECQICGVFARCGPRLLPQSLVCYPDSGSCAPRTASQPGPVRRSGAFVAWACSGVPARGRKHSASVTRHYEQICNAKVHLGSLSRKPLMPKDSDSGKAICKFNDETGLQRCDPFPYSHGRLREVICWLVCPMQPAS